MSSQNNSRPKSNLLTQQAADQTLVDGITKHQAKLPPSFHVTGVDVPTTSIVTTLKARIAARAAVAPAKAAYQIVVAASRDEIAGSKALVADVRAVLAVMFAGEIDLLGDLGLKQRKAPAPRTPEQKAASVAKAKATRERRLAALRSAEAPAGTPAVTAATPVASPAPAPAAAPSAAPATAAVPKS